MSHAYQAVGWNRQKRIYDFTLLGLVLLAASVFGTVTALRHPETTAETFIIRFTAITAFLLLHITLAIGPLVRLLPSFLPLLYNRRHLGVTLACLGMIHGAFAIIQFHALGDRNPLVSVFTAYSNDYLAPLYGFRSISHFPFEILGFLALTILFLMAATSHDFWLHNLGPRTWKRLHQLVYVAYALLLAHVLLGIVQSERGWAFPGLTALGFCGLVILHLMAAAKERRMDQQRNKLTEDGFEEVATTSDLIESVGKVVVAGGVRFALFVSDGKLFALSNVCRHQGGPIGEGRVVKGCITCPWHGFQYKPEDGCSPPPFHEVLETYPLKIMGDRVFLSPTALPMGTKSEGVPLPLATTAAPQPFYIGWQSKMAPELASRIKKAVIGTAVALPMIVGLLVWFQNPVDRGHYEFGIEKTFEGTLYEFPVPRLRLDAGEGKSVDHILVGAGKFGPGSIIAGADGHRVRFSGSLIIREPFRMIELNRPDTFVILDKDAPPAPQPTVSPLGAGSFTGELVDTKCWSGVMRPATGKVHRACAIRCLSGGVPPGLLVRDGSGDGMVLLLAGPAGEALKYDIQLAGTFIDVRGTLELNGGTPVLRVDSISPHQK
jgi:DMSO/TMAO reductase YedYZ heme-binding membrane subunit/nitrite reductase/ring-hydroxylating ferredoxin subunit